MSINMIECNREQTYLLPPSLRDWLPENDLAWFVVDAIEGMDLKEFCAGMRGDGRGGASFPPSMMVALLVYAYCLGVRSSRQIEKLCERDIAFRVIAANQVPDHTTIARFRQEHAEKLSGLFNEVLRLCAQAGMIKLGVVALDGTKMKVEAALSANRTDEGIRKEVERILKEAAEIDEAEDRKYGKDKRGDELPKELANRESRLKRLRECREQLKREAAAEAAKQKEKIEKRKEEEEKTGKKKRGRKPKEADEVVSSEGKANVSDPESRIMKTRNGYVQGYNAQVVVDEGQLIIAADVTNEQNDKKQLIPMLDKAKESLMAVSLTEETIGAVLADAGYCSDENLKKLPEGKTRFLINTVNERERRQGKDAKPPRGRIPQGLTVKERMDRRLRTKAGHAIYKRRGVIVEPVFSMIKSARGVDRFNRRGLIACVHEWKLICATHNLLKLWRENNRKREAALAKG